MTTLYSILVRELAAHALHIFTRQQTRLQMAYTSTFSSNMFLEGRLQHSLRTTVRLRRPS